MGSLVTSDLGDGPFTVADARRVGLAWESLQTKSWQRLSRGQYSAACIRPDAELTLRAVGQRMPSGFAFSGHTAAWLLGLDVSPREPVEVTVPRGSSIRARAGVKLRRAALVEDEVTLRHGFRVTNALRTVCDLGARRDLIESVVAIDMALHASLVDIADLAEWISRNSGAKGVKRLRRAVGFAEPLTESPMETRLRMTLINARLPRPLAQVELHDRAGRFLGRADFVYPDVKLVIEFDGQNHKDRLTEDLRRQNALVNAGFHILRFTTADLMSGRVAAQVRHARNRLLRNAG